MRKNLPSSLSCYSTFCKLDGMLQASAIETFSLRHHIVFKTILKKEWDSNTSDFSEQAHYTFLSMMVPSGKSF
jgi:hypothetical protein